MFEDSVTTTEAKPIPRRHDTVTTIVVLLVAVLIGMALIYSPRFFAKQALAPEVADTSMQVQGVVMEKSVPTKLLIPSINVDTSFEEPLGLKDDGEIETPASYDKVAYYKNGPTPGELGPSVILGHVDSVDGPAVFFSLGQLKEGDEIKVEREDGSIAVFAVTTLERHLQSGFPTAKVYSDIDHAGLRLITCTGIYEKDKLRYTHNLIVYAKLVRVE